MFTSSFGCTRRFVDVHVGLSAGTGLPDDEGKFTVVTAFERFIARLDDGSALLLVEHAECHIDHRGRTLDHDLSMHDGQRHRLAGKFEVDAAALGLRAPQPFRRHFDVAECIAFDPEFPCHCRSPVVQ
jgi:hypothetical protein